MAQLLRATEPPIGAVLLDELRDLVTQYVVLPDSDTTDAVVLWIAASHGIEAFETAPRLVITAAGKRCGKSRLLDVVEATCARPLATGNTTAAALVRSIGDGQPPTLLVDEVDVVFKSGNEELRGLLNAGFQRGKPYLRCEPKTNKVEVIESFAMAALAGIGNLPDTVMDRAVVVRMRPRAQDETVSTYRLNRDRPRLTAFAERLAEWITSVISRLRMSEPEMPVEDRAADTWEPLIAVADAAGGTWPERARTAAVTLTERAQEDDREESDTLMLLRHFRDHVFTGAEKEKASTEVALSALRGIPDHPQWVRDLDAATMAKMLRPYGIKPKNIRVPQGVRRGYRREWFVDSWIRWLGSGDWHDPAVCEA
jgi:hypothetical protein